MRDAISDRNLNLTSTRAQETCALQSSSQKARISMNGLLSMVSRASEVGFIKGMTATAAVDFFNHLNMLYGTVTEFCTPEQVSLRPSRSRSE